jgi:hypothetical protein
MAVAQEAKFLCEVVSKLVLHIIFVTSLMRVSRSEIALISPASRVKLDQKVIPCMRIVIVVHHSNGHEGGMHIHT